MGRAGATYGENYLRFRNGTAYDAGFGSFTALLFLVSRFTLIGSDTDRPLLFFPMSASVKKKWRCGVNDSWRGKQLRFASF